MAQREYSLQSLSNEALLVGLGSVARAHQRVTAELLAYLAELDERRLFLDLGFASLWEYCIEVLKLCESTAGRYIAAARACRKCPQAFALVASGELHASALSSMNKHLNPDNAAELLAACTGKSARKAEEILAARFPRPDVPDSVRRLPAQSATPNVESSLEATSRRLEPLSADRYGVHFTANGEFRDLLERVRGLAGHRLPDDLMTLMKRGLEAYERELEKERFAVGRNPRAQPQRSAASDGAANGQERKRRHSKAAVASTVYARDEKQCAFVAVSGRRCTSRFRLQLDHVQPFAFGGEDAIANQRLLCRAHNLLHARRCFGKAYMRAAVARARRTQSGSQPPRVDAQKNRPR